MLTQAELNKVRDAIENAQQVLGATLNQHLDAGDITIDEANALRLTAISLSQANKQVFFMSYSVECETCGVSFKVSVTIQRV